jgi:hypothetical protein
MIKIQQMKTSRSDTPLRPPGACPGINEGVQKLLIRFLKNPDKKFFGGPGGDFSKKPPGRRRQESNAAVKNR